MYSDFDSNLGYASIQLRLQTDKTNMKCVDNIARNKSIAINSQYRENYESYGPNTTLPSIATSQNRCENFFKNHINSTTSKNQNILQKLCWKYYDKHVESSQKPVHGKSRQLWTKCTFERTTKFNRKVISIQLRSEIEIFYKNFVKKIWRTR